jgi:hypothetical protein
MADLLSQNIVLNLDDVNGVEISPIGDGRYELYIGDICITCKCRSDLKTLCLNIQSAYEKTLRFSEELEKADTPLETVRVIHETLNKLAGVR